MPVNRDIAEDFLVSSKSRREKQHFSENTYMGLQSEGDKHESAAKIDGREFFPKRLIFIFFF